MITKLFTVYDSKVEAYLPPFYMQSTGGAMRSFEDTCNDPETGFHKHPEDYTLFEVGTFDDTNCTYNLLTTPIALCKAIELKTQPQLSGVSNG